jgi:hypothetical protein
MKIFRIKNRRNSLATNSSSTHSVVYKNKEQVFEDLGIFDNLNTVHLKTSLT